MIHLAKTVKFKTSSDSPIFVVGVPRSGTTLLAAMLGAHSHMSCGPETGIFNALATLPRRKHRALCNYASWPLPAVNFLCELVRNGKPLIENYGLSRGEIDSYLRNRQPSISAILSALTEQFMRKRGKIRWVEKTPSHLLSLSLIRRNFPDSPIIRIVRDPRDVALSLLKVPWGPGSFPGGIALWRNFDDISAAFFNSDKRSYTIRYEDLVSFPEEQLRQLCWFLKVPFEDGMMDTSYSGREVNRTNEPWKENVKEALDKTRCACWQTQLTKDDIRLADSVVGDRLANYYGYSLPSDFVGYCTFFPLLAAKNYPQVLTMLAERRLRLWPARKSEKPLMELYVGHPDEDGWLTRLSEERLVKTLSIGMRALNRKLAGRHLYWIFEQDQPRKEGICSTLIKFVMKMLATIGSPRWFEQK